VLLSATRITVRPTRSSWRLALGATGVAVPLPALQAKFELSATTIAILVAGKWAASSITQPFLGALAHQVDRRARGLVAR
jgi:hypothetical protein